MPAANNSHRTTAVMAALDLDSRMPPNARLWLALAAMKCDEKGRTQFGAHGYSRASNDTIDSGQAAVDWLNHNGVILPDHDDDGIECWRLTHHDWHRDPGLIRGYGRDAGQKRDGLPPQYGRRVSDVIEPNGKKHTPPPAVEVHWSELVTQPAEEASDE